MGPSSATAGSPEPPRRRRPTLSDVAEVAGVSIATASHAFNRPDRIAPTTRERVLAAAAALDYAGPDPAARALRRGVPTTITLIGPGPAAELWARPAAALFCQGVAEGCDRAGVAMTLAGPDTDHGGPSVAFRPMPGSDLGPGRVVVDGGGGGLAVDADIPGAAAEIAEHIAQLGHRRLAVVGATTETVRAEHLRRAWRSTGPVVAVTAPGLGRGDGEVAAVAALAEDPDLTAIVAISDELALGAIDGAARRGLRVPEDLSVAGIDDVPEAALRGLTTAFVPYRPMGELAVSLALGGDPAPPPFPAPIAVRATTAAARR